MSYTFGIWQHTEGGSLMPEDIQNIFEEAWEYDLEPSILIKDMVQAVSVKFSDGDDELDDSSAMVWDWSPLIEQAKGMTFYPGVRLSLGEEVLEDIFEFLLIESEKRGLHLIDWQTGEIYPPNEENPIP